MVRRVLIADSNTRLANVLAQLLADEEDFDVVGVCDTPRRVLDRAREARPDVVLISETLGGEPGDEVCRSLREALPRAALLMWCREAAVPAAEDDVVDALLERGLTFRELVRTLRRALRHGPGLARPAPRPSLRPLDEQLRPAPVARSAGSPPEVPAPADSGLLLTCDSCGLRLPVDTTDMVAGIAQAREFFATHDGCRTSIDLHAARVASGTA